jgi:hypothetical protein
LNSLRRLEKRRRPKIQQHCPSKDQLTSWRLRKALVPYKEGSQNRLVNLHLTPWTGLKPRSTRR